MAPAQRQLHPVLHCARSFKRSALARHRLVHGAIFRWPPGSPSDPSFQAWSATKLHLHGPQLCFYNAAVVAPGFRAKLRPKRKRAHRVFGKAVTPSGGRRFPHRLGQWRKSKIANQHRQSVKLPVAKNCAGAATLFCHAIKLVKQLTGHRLRRITT